MNASQAIHVLESSLSSILLIFVLLKLWPELRLDSFRQEMFALRDELFDFADAGNISFSHPSYRLLRRSMNGFIRFGHQLTFFRLCMTLLRWKFGLEKPNLGWARSLSQSLKTIPDESVRTRLEAFHSRAFVLVFRRLIMGSPLLIFAVMTVTITMLLRMGWGHFRQACRDASTRVVEWLVDPRMIEEEAMRVSA